MSQIDLRIVLWNANGLSQHVQEIKLYLKNDNIDILLVSETHFTDKTFIRIPGYDIIHCNHPQNKAHGGSAIIIKSVIKYEEMESFCTTSIQATIVRVKCHNENIVLSAVYCPPRFSLKSWDFENLFAKMGPKFLAGGDFNAKHPWWGSRLVNPKGSEMYKCIAAKNYSVLSTGTPTYWPTDRRKTPDLIDFFVFSGIQRAHFQVSECYDLSSDHSPIKVTFSSLIYTNSQKQRIDFPKFKTLLEERLDLSVCLKRNTDVDKVAEELSSFILKAAVDSSVPIKPTNANLQHVSTELRNLIAEKRRLRKTWQSTRHPASKRLLNKACRDLKRMLYEMKNQQTAEFLKSLDRKDGEEFGLWKATKYLKRPALQNPPIRNHTGEWCRTNKEKADLFANHLSEIFKPFDSCNLPHDEKVTEFLEAPYQMDLPIKPIRYGEIIHEISNLKPKKAPGHDGITGLIAKNLPRKGLLLLTFLCNAILRTGTFPTSWKIAEVVMIIKPGKPQNEATSYRPISLLVIFSKIFERLFLKRMQGFLSDAKAIPDHQFGFRQGHGTVEQCHRVAREIQKTLEDKKYCSAVFLDVQQAFDRVWFPGLNYKIKKLLPSPFYAVLSSFLSNREFYVRHKDEKSGNHMVKAGVPQGSVLGPVLYTIHTHDMPVEAGITVATYADDTGFLAVSASRTTASTKLQKQLDSFETWSKTWRIRVNPSKSKHMTFALRRGNCPQVKLNGEILEHCESVKYLGVHLDRRLVWKDHIKAKRKQLDIKTKQLYWLLKPKSQLSLENKLLIYKCILKPVWTYCLQLWGSASNSNVEIIQRYQSKTLRMILGAPWFVSNQTLHNDLKVPTVLEEARRFTENYKIRLQDHQNILAVNLLETEEDTRRLRRYHILDSDVRY